MNKHFSLLTVLPLLQSLLDPAARSLKLAEQVLVIYIIDLNAKMCVLFPVFKVFEIILEDRDDVRDASASQRGLAA